MPYRGLRRKVFISFHQADRAEVSGFVGRWAHREKVFIPKALGVSDNDDFINSTKPEYVMTQIRRKYLGDSTVTIVLIGTCTLCRRYVDWEIKSSLRMGGYTPNGLLGILLPGCGGKAFLPPRFEENWSSTGDCYAQFLAYPTSAAQLGQWIEGAYAARTQKAYLINNSKDMMKYNSRCRKCGETH